MVPVSNDYLYGCRGGEMGEKAKGEDGEHTMLLISLLMLKKLHVSLYFSIEVLWVNILWYVKNIFSFLD